MSVIRVLYCIEAMVHGGTEKQLAALVRGLDRRRVEPFLCVLKPSAMTLAELDCEVIELGFRTFRSPSALGCVRRLRRFIVERRIDVVQTFFQDPLLIGWLASLGTPVSTRIATFRDMGFWRTPAKVAQLRLAYRSFHGFIANSSAVARNVHEQDGIALDRIAVIPNGVAMSGVPVHVGLNTVPVVGIVANLDRPVKRVDLFLEMARVVRDAVGGVEFVIIGDGPLRPSLTAQAERLGIGANVRFLGSMTDVRDEVRKFDIGVISSDSEGLSNAILEYMAAGVPTVARAVGGNADAVIDGKTGRLVTGASAESLSRPVLDLLGDAGARRRMGECAREVAERSFSVDACIGRHQDYYARLLASVPVRGTRVAWSPR